MQHIFEPLAEEPRPTLVHDCPRCGAHAHTFDVVAAIAITVEHGWRVLHEAFARCRRCCKTTVFWIANKDMVRKRIDQGWLMSLAPRNLNECCDIEGYVKQSDMDVEEPPRGTPGPVDEYFREAVRCRAVSAWNGCGCMLRAALEEAVGDLERETSADGRSRQDENLKSRLNTLLENGTIPRDLQPMADCIRLDGNDAVHGRKLTEEDAETLLDFVRLLLTRVYSYREDLEAAEERRRARRKRTHTET